MNVRRGQETEIIDWNFSKKQGIVLKWWLHERWKNCAGIFCDGSVRSGKTTAMAFGFMMWSMETFNGMNFGLCGKTIKSFERNVLGPMKTMLPYLGYSFNHRKADNLVVIRNSQYTNYFYLFGGNDEKSQDLIQGITLAGLFLDEVVLMPESFVAQAFARCSVEGAKIWMNANPEGPQHYIKRHYIDEFEQRNFLHLHFTMKDNLSLSDERRTFYEQQWTGVFYRRYILGEWCLADGLVYSMFDPKTMTFDEDRHPEDYDSLIISCDYGIQNPTAFLMLGFNWDTNRIEVFKEYYYSGRDTQQPKTDDELYNDLVAFAGNAALNRVYVDPSASSFLTLIAKKAQFRWAKADNAVTEGISLVSQLFNMKQLAIHKSCKNTIAELRTYAWDTEKSVKQGEDIVLKTADHTCDALRYGIQTYYKYRLQAYRLGYYSDIA